jgi:hypothetical protein
MKRGWWWGALACAAVAFATSAARAEQSSVVDLGGLKSKAPADWKAQKPSSAMRLYHFRVPHAEGDSDDAEMIVFFFREGGGSADANVDRWKKMFVPPEGKSIDDVSKVEKMKVADSDVTYLDVHGSYRMKKRPFDPNEKGELKPDYRLIGVVFETKNGPYYIRFVGPEKTLEQHKKDFDDWLKAFK